MSVRCWGMRDTRELRRRLEAALGIVTLTLGAGACERVDKTSEVVADPSTTKATTQPTVTAAPTPSPSPSVIDPPPEPTVGFPTGGGGCAPVAWCGSALLAKSVAKSGSANKLGCTVSLEQGGPPSPKIPWFAYGELDEPATKTARADAGPADTCCYQLHRLCGGGRPLVDGDVARVAEVRPGSAWHTEIRVDSSLVADVDERRAIGERWLVDARMEHASVASFARAALELMSVGAPSEIVADCHRAALDEVRHARICFAVASRFLGRDVEPGALELPAARPCSLVDIARSTLIEGCFGETSAALIASRAAEACVDEGMGEALRSIADDEANHAALAFRIVGWCLKTGGFSVARALDEEVAKLRQRPDAETLDELVVPLLASMTAMTSTTAARPPAPDSRLQV